MDDGPPDAGLAYHLHALVARLDRSADAILRAELGLTYPRFLLLLTVAGEDGLTQRSLADRLGVTEPTTSRTVAALEREGLLTAGVVPGAGNRRQVRLTQHGRRVLSEAADRLEGRFRSVVEAVGADYAALSAVTRDLAAALAARERPSPARGTDLEVPA